jgi:hypothetical protein
MSLLKEPLLILACLAFMGRRDTFSAKGNSSILDFFDTDRVQNFEEFSCEISTLRP